MSHGYAEFEVTVALLAAALDLEESDRITFIGGIDPERQTFRLGIRTPKLEGVLLDYPPTITVTSDGVEWKWEADDAS